MAELGGSKKTRDAIDLSLDMECHLENTHVEINEISWAENNMACHPLEKSNKIESALGSGDNGQSLLR